MKNLLKFLSVILITVLVIPVYAQKEDIVVASDQNLDVGEFENYKTFTFAQQIDDDQNNSFFWDSESLKSVLRDEIRAELQSLGYEFIESTSEKTDADLVVNFQVIKEDTEMIGWEDVETVTGYWGFEVVGQNREMEDKTTYNLEKGTIIVHLADAEQGVVVWRGFASGIVEDTELSSGDEVKIHEAVARIFDKYNYTASK